MSEPLPHNLQLNPDSIDLEENAIDINLKLYIFLKHLNNSHRLTENQLREIQLTICTHYDLVADDLNKINRLKDILRVYLETIKNQAKRENFLEFV